MLIFEINLVELSLNFEFCLEVYWKGAKKSEKSGLLPPSQLKKKMLKMYL